jgi:hypothetical protein
MQKLKAGRHTISGRAVKGLASGLLAIALFVAVSVTASAQVECLGVCEEQYANCLREPGSGTQSASCQDTYEACVDACLGRYAGILS